MPYSPVFGSNEKVQQIGMANVRKDNWICLSYVLIYLASLILILLKEWYFSCFCSVSNHIFCCFSCVATAEWLMELFLDGTLLSNNMDTSNFAHVIFQNVGKSYLPHAALECHYTLTQFIKPNPKDWVGIFKVNNHSIYYESL